jgi:hypothetical protein
MKAAAGRNESEKTEKKPKECTQCHFMKPAGVYVCPKCGFKPIGGENVETDSSRKLQRLSRKEKIYTRSDKQSWWSQIKGYQRQRAVKGKPLSDGWCAHTFRDKFGEWPNGLSNFPMETGPEVWGYIKSKFIAFSKSRGAA